MADTSMVIPLFPQMSADDVERVIEVLRAAVRA